MFETVHAKSLLLFYRLIRSKSFRGYIPYWIWWWWIWYPLNRRTHIILNHRIRCLENVNVFLHTRPNRLYAAWNREDRKHWSQFSGGQFRPFATFAQYVPAEYKGFLFHSAIITPTSGYSRAQSTSNTPNIFYVPVRNPWPHISDIFMSQTLNFPRLSIPRSNFGVRMENSAQNFRPIYFVPCWTEISAALVLRSIPVRNVRYWISKSKREPSAATFCTFFGNRHQILLSLWADYHFFFSSWKNCMTIFWIEIAFRQIRVIILYLRFLNSLINTSRIWQGILCC